MLVEGFTVEAGEGEIVLGEVPRHPVHQHTDAVLVKGVNKGAEFIRGAPAGTGCEVAGHLISPGTTEGVFRDG